MRKAALARGRALGTPRAPAALQATMPPPPLAPSPRRCLVGAAAALLLPLLLARADVADTAYKNVEVDDGDKPSLRAAAEANLKTCRRRISASPLPLVDAERARAPGSARRQNCVLREA